MFIFTTRRKSQFISCIDFEENVKIYTSRENPEFVDMKLIT